MGLLWNNETATFCYENSNGTLIQTYIVHFYNTKLIIVYVRLTRILSKVYLYTDAHCFAWRDCVCLLRIYIKNIELSTLASTVIRLTIRESFSGKVTIRESSFQETSRPWIKPSRKRLSEKRRSGKMTIRENYYPGNDCIPSSYISNFTKPWRYITFYSV